MRKRIDERQDFKPYLTPSGSEVMLACHTADNPQINLATLSLTRNHNGLNKLTARRFATGKLDPSHRLNR